MITPASFRQWQRSELASIFLDTDDVHENKRQRGVFGWIAMSLLMIFTYLSIICESSVAPRKDNPFIGPPSDALDRWGSKNAALILGDGQYWRFLSTLFLTHGLVDLICSVAVVSTFGRSLEQRWGTARWLLIYICSGTMYSTRHWSMQSGVFSCEFV